MTSFLNGLLHPTRVFRGWWIVYTGTFALILSGGATSYVFSVLVTPMQDEMGWSRATVVGVVAMGRLVEGVLSAPLGPLFDRYGARWLMAGGAVFGGLCFLLTGAVTEAWQFYLLIGLGEAITHPALQNIGPRTAIANWFARNRPPAFAVYSIGRSISGVLLVPIAVWILDIASWRWVYVAVGLAEIFVLAPLCWMVVRRRPEDLGLQMDGDPPGRLPDTSPQAAAAVAEDAAPWTRSSVMRTKTYWFLVIGFLLIAFPASAIFIQMAAYAQEKGLSAAAAATTLSVYGFGALWGRPVWAWVTSRTSIRNALTLFALTYGASVLWYTWAGGELAVYASVFSLGMTVGGSAQLQGQVWPDYYGRRVVGAVTGIATFLNTPASAGSTVLLAVVYDLTHKSSTVLTVYAGLALAAAVFFFLSTKPVPPIRVAKATETIAG